MTHFLPRHGRFLYLIETLMLSQYHGQQGHPEWEVKIRDIGNIPLFKLKLIPSIQIAWLPGVIKTSSRTVLETFETQELNENNFYPISSKIWPQFCEIPNSFPLILLKYCQYPLFWLLTLGGPVGHDIDLTSEFLLGTEIAHVWEENESLVIRYCGIQGPIRASWKISVKTGHPVAVKR